MVDSYNKTENHVGPLVPLELALTFPRQESWSYQQKVDFVKRVSEELSAHPQIERVFSSVDLLDRLIPQLLHKNAVPPVPEIKKQATESIIASSLSALSDMRYIARDTDGREVWRITSMTSALGDTKYNELLIELEEELQSSIQNATTDTVQPILFRFAGIMPLVHNIQQQLLNDLFSSFLSAFAIIFAILALALGSFAKATIAMIPNLFPIVLLFGALGWSGSAIDIGTIMTASIAIGIAVDDTLHFLTMYEKVLATPMNRFQAVQHVYEHCGIAILNTTIVCVLGMAVFSLNDFIPTARFSWMMAGLLTLAVVGDLILLPALLLSPLGYFFDRAHAVGTRRELEFETELMQTLPQRNELLNRIDR